MSTAKCDIILLVNVSHPNVIRMEIIIMLYDLLDDWNQ